MPTRSVPSGYSPLRRQQSDEHVTAILVFEFAQRLVFLHACQPRIHDHEHREHHQRQQRRPLQQEAQHDDNESNILRVPHILIDGGRRQCVPALRVGELSEGKPRMTLRPIPFPEKVESQGHQG